MAFGESWLISVMMRFTSNGSRIMNELGNSASKANAILDTHTKKVNAATAAWERFSVASVKAGTMFAGGFAATGAAAIVYGINQAAKLELAMTGVYAATGANLRQQSQLRNMVMQISGVTAQSATTIANELFMVGSSGLNDPKQLMAAFPQIAKAADVLWLSTMGTPKAVDPVHASMQMMKLSHLFGAYQGKPLADMVDAIVRLQMVQPDALAKVVTQARYFVPAALGAGVSIKNLPQSDLMVLMASMGQQGFMQGKGGTGLAAFIQYMDKAPTLTAHLSKIQRASMIDLGLFDSSGRNKFLDSHQNLKLGEAVHYLGEKFDSMVKEGRRGDFMADLYGAFLRQGGAFTAAMLLPQVRAQRQRNILGMERIAPPGTAVERLWDKYMHTTIGAWKYFVTNFENVWIYGFTPMLPTVTAFLRGLGYEFGRFGNTLKDHPGMAQALANILIGLTALSTARFLLGGGTWLFTVASGFGKLAPELSLTSKALMTLDNFVLAGMGARLLKLTKYWFDLDTAALASAAPINNVAGALRALAAAGGAFLLSPLGRLISAGGGILTGAYISMQQHSSAKATYDAVAHKYGAHYANTLLHGAPGWNLDWHGLHKGGGSYGGWPYNYGPNDIPAGAPRPHNGPTHVSMTNHIEIKVPKGTSAEQAKEIIKMAMAGIRSEMASSGMHFTSRNAPPVLNLDLASPSLGLS